MTLSAWSVHHRRMAWISASVTSSFAKAEVGGLVAPDVTAAGVVRLIEDDESAGLIVAVRADRAPHLLDPEGVDPHWS